jgi:hypothetical protein
MNGRYLEAAYWLMAQEAEALDWAEETLADVADDPM